jgi:type I restriction enzyme S subunit
MTTRWGDICTLEYGKALRNCPEEPSEIDCYRVYGTNGPIGWSSQSLCKECGVIIGRKGAYRGVHFSPEPFFVIDTAFYLRLKDRSVNLKWAYYKLLTVDINRIDVGAAIPTTNRDSFYAVPVNVPSLSTQQRIASILSAYDDLIENNLRRIKLLEESTRQLYKEWFVRLRFPGYEHTKIINGVPDGWEKKTAFDAMDIQSGGTPSTKNPEYWDGEIPFYTPKDFSNSPYAIDTERYITENGLSNCNSKLYPKNTVFISARGTVGKIIMAERLMAMSQTSYALTGINGIAQLFLYCSLQSALQQF